MMSLGSDARLRTPSLRSLNCWSRSRHRTDDSLALSGPAARSPPLSYSLCNPSQSAPSSRPAATIGNLTTRYQQPGARRDRTLWPTKNDNGPFMDRMRLIRSSFDRIHADLLQAARERGFSRGGHAHLRVAPGPKGHARPTYRLDFRTRLMHQKSPTGSMARAWCKCLADRVETTEGAGTFSLRRLNRTSLR